MKNVRNPDEFGHCAAFLPFKIKSVDEVMSATGGFKEGFIIVDLGLYLYPSIKMYTTVCGVLFVSFLDCNSLC